MVIEKGLPGRSSLPTFENTRIRYGVGQALQILKLTWSTPRAFEEIA